MSDTQTTHVNDVDSDSDDEYDQGEDQGQGQGEGKSKNTPDDVGTCLMDTIKNINIKRALFVFVFFLLITSTTFVDGVLAKRDGCTVGIMPTVKGTVCQGIFLVLAFIAVDLLITFKCI